MTKKYEIKTLEAFHEPCLYSLQQKNIFKSTSLYNIYIKSIAQYYIIRKPSISLFISCFLFFSCFLLIFFLFCREIFYMFSRYCCEILSNVEVEAEAEAEAEVDALSVARVETLK